MEAASVGSFAVRRTRRIGAWCLMLAVLMILVGGAWTPLHTPHRLPGQVGRPDLAASKLAGTNTTAFTVNATDRPSYTPNSIEVPDKAPFTVKVVNVGLFNHTFTLLKTPGVSLATNMTPTEVDQAVNGNGTFANDTLAPGGSVVVNLTLTPTFPNGSTEVSYEFLSVIPYQFQAGMYGFINVTASTPVGPPQVVFLNASSALQFIPSQIGVLPTELPVEIHVGVGVIGALAHTFTVDPVPNDTAINPSNYATYLQGHPPPAGGNVNLNPGNGITWANFTLSKPGIYTFLCEIPGHYAAGMNGSLYVGVPLPPPSVPPSTALVEPILLGIAGGLVVVGSILIAVAYYQGRFH